MTSAWPTPTPTWELPGDSPRHPRDCPPVLLAALSPTDLASAVVTIATATKTRRTLSCRSDNAADLLIHYRLINSRELKVDRCPLAPLAHWGEKAPRAAAPPLHSWPPRAGRRVDYWGGIVTELHVSSALNGFGSLVRIRAGSEQFYWFVSVGRCGLRQGYINLNSYTSNQILY